MVRSMLVELEVGPTPPAQLAEIVDSGLFDIAVEGVVDAKAVFDSVTADVADELRARLHDDLVALQRAVRLAAARDVLTERSAPQRIPAH